METLSVKFSRVNGRSYAYEVIGSQEQLDEYCDNVEQEAALDSTGKYKLIEDADSGTPLWFVPRYQILVNEVGDELEVEVPPPFKSGQITWLDGKTTDSGDYLLGRYRAYDDFESSSKRANENFASALKAGFKKRDTSKDSNAPAKASTDANLAGPIATPPATPTSAAAKPRARARARK
jgi:hypothetical protein